MEGIKSFKKVASFFLAGAMTFSAMGMQVQAMTSYGSTTQPGLKVEVTTGEVNTVVNSVTSDLTSVGPIYHGWTEEECKARELHYGMTEDPAKVSVTEAAPAGYPYQLLGDGQYSHQYVSRIFVNYQEDETTGEPLKDEDGNYIYKLFCGGSYKHYPLTSLGEATTDLAGPFDQKTGLRASQFLLENEAGDAVYAYCVDLETPYVLNEWYAVANLEDNDYYVSEDSEAHVRAIVLNGYWGTESGTGSLAQIKEALKAAIKAGTVDKEVTVTFNDNKERLLTETVTLTDEIIDGMTEGEALDMTQAAIWSYANGTKDILDGKDRQIVGDIAYGDSAKGNDSREARNDFEGAARMKALYQMLTTMEADSEPTVVINDKNFVDTLKLTVGDKVEGTENTYNVDLCFTLGAEPSEKDDLLLTIGVGNETITKRLAGDATDHEKISADANGFYTIKGLKLEAGTEFAITMDIKGAQYLKQDAYIYTAQSGRTGSQTLVGLAEGYTTVDATMSSRVAFDLVDYVDREINFYKTTKVDGREYALEGIEFDIYYLCTVDEYTENLKTSGTYETPSLSLVDEEDYVATVKTGASGNATYNLTDNNWPDGIYLIAEKEHPAIVEPLDPFYVAVPRTSEDGSDLIYKVDITPKNDLVTPDIKKDVTEIENNLDTVNAGEEFTWIVRSDVPADIADAKSYVITDTLDYRLTYAEDLVVKVEEIAAEANNSVSSGDVLIADADYTLSTVDKSVTVSGRDAESTKEIVVSLTEDGMDKVANLVGENSEAYEIRVYFNTTIDEDAAMGELIPNQAILEYTNSTNFAFEVESDIPEVYTCGINIKKYDAKDNTKYLSGAEFMVARKATAEEIADETIETKTLVIGNGQAEEVVFVEFYNNTALTGEKVKAVTTDANGDAVIYGLEEIFEEDGATAKYYLVEIKAPAGYNLLSYPKAIELNKISHLDANTMNVANSNAFELPSTGGIGTTIFTTAGIAMIAFAGVVFAVSRRKREE